LRVRPAAVADLPALLSLGDQLLAVDLGGRVRGAPAAARASQEQRYLEAIDDLDRHLVVVVDERDEVIAMAMLTVSSVNALVDMPAAHLTHSVVSDGHKKRGAGKALVAAAASFAEQRGLDQLVVSVHPGSRDANRFFARLGFAPLVVRRVAPLAVVRRRLAQDDNRPIDHVARYRPRRPGRRHIGLPLGRAEGGTPVPDLLGP